MRTAAALLFILCASCAHAPRSGSVPVEAVAPRAADVASIDGLVRAFYEVVNVGPDEPRQWGRDRTLYSPWIHFIGIGKALDIYDHQALVDETEPMVREGFREVELKRVVRRYGNIAHVFSTYQTARGKGFTKIDRGVNSLQLYFDGKRWWIESCTWQSEDAEHPIPAELLP